MHSTKRNIIEKSISLFNEHGFANVSLHQIAKSLQLSSGNLTYHFPRKEDLMLGVYSTFLEELKLLQLSIGEGRTIQKMILEAREFAKFQKRYMFFYLDLLDIERKYPTIAKKHHKHIKGQIARIKQSLEYNLQIGVIKSSLKSDIENLAETIWMTVVFWPSQMSVRGLNNSSTKLVAAIESLLKPYIYENQLQVLNKKYSTVLQN